MRRRCAFRRMVGRDGTATCRRARRRLNRRAGDGTSRWGKDCKDMENGQLETPLTGQMLGENGAGAFVGSLHLYLRIRSRLSHTKAEHFPSHANCVPERGAHSPLESRAGRRPAAQDFYRSAPFTAP